ncbi:TonB-dependent receptor [Sphingomonas sp. M1-B02]|uniref:TonB-dependent receptor n=1 Tax=Sphingomonas sp. M1-B02 TaxID=3114300 RepID=UPI00223F2E2E|nr:TonB-dependent receptor plug domain-containing protein [Sphingomonas sp. S6-11]UZK66405.1 TonB-dependent receptor [Sphingomonas sp. S6-11]
MKKLDLLAATAVSLFLAAPAFAQDATPAAEAAPADEDYQSANDIVVTATRRNETVQQVPIAITAIGAELLQNAGVDNVRDLEQLAPSLQSSTGQSSATGTTIYLRGITTGGDNPGFEPAVGVFIDGVFRSRAGVAISELPELERIEVLRGPQGTLFGRNTSAGALSIFTAQPQFETQGYIEGTYGNYNAYGVRGAITGPISRSVALRVDAGYRKRDGYIEDVNSDRSINDINRWNVRGQALIDSGDVTFRLIGDYSETDEQCCGAISAVRGATAQAVEAVAGAQRLDGLYFTPGTTRNFPLLNSQNVLVQNPLNFSAVPLERRQAISPNRDYAERVKDWGISGELNWDIGDVKMTSITAYRDWKATRNQDIDFSGIDRAYRDGYRTRIRDFTQELRFQGSALGGKLDWLIGGFYLNERNDLKDVVRFGNDANRYVDAVLNGATRSAALPTGAQFFGTLGNTAPLFGQVLLAQNPIVAAPPGPGLPPVRLLNIAPPGSALFSYLNSPLTGNPAGVGNNDDVFHVKTDAIALFTHNIINVSDMVSVTLGARWNHESKKLTASINNNTPACAFFSSADPRAATYRALISGASSELYRNLFLLSCNPAVSSEFNGNYTDSFSDNEITGTAKLALKLSSKLLAYGSYDHGYKSGGYNLDQATFDSALIANPATGRPGNGAQASDLYFGAETVDAFELGLKASPSRAFTFNVALFYQKFYNFQSLVFSGNNFVVQNVPKTVSKGAELESTIRPHRDLTFQLGYSYISAKYDQSNAFAGTPLAGQQGQQVNNQPEHTVTIAGTWTPTISNGIRGLVHVDMRYNSEVNIPSSNPDPATGRTVLFNPGYALLNGSIGLQTDDGKIRGEFFVENATNQYFHVTGFAVPEQTGNFAAYPGTPRFYGARLRFGF